MTDPVRAPREVTVLARGFSFTEAPRWHEGRLYFVDFFGPTVHALEADGSVVDVAEVPHRPSGLGWLPDGRMLVVSMRDRRVLRQEPDGRLVEHADLSALCSTPANDMVVAGNGQAYVGHFGFDVVAGADHAPASVVLVEPDGRARTVAEGLSFPNGMVITPDGRLLVNELFGDRVSAFDIARTARSVHAGTSRPTGTRGTSRRWRGGWRVPRSCRTAWRSTPRARSGSPTPSIAGRCG